MTNGAAVQRARRPMLRTRVRAGPLAGLVMSVVLAGVLTVLLLSDHLLRGFEPAFGQPSPTTLRVPAGLRISRDAPGSKLRVDFAPDDVVVPRGTVLSRFDEAHQLAVSWDAQLRKPTALRALGAFTIFCTLALALTGYLRRFGQNRLRLMRSQVGLLVAVGVLALLAKLGLLFTALPAYWIPVGAVPLWVATSFDRRTAFVVTVVLSLTVAAFAQLDAMLLAVVLGRGMASTLFYLNRKRKRHMLVSGALAGLSASAMYFALRVAVEGRFDALADLMRGIDGDLVACTGGGLLAGLLAAGLRSPAERLLGHVPRERLLDLTDLEQPVLQKLSREAPGTWEHSRAMANLAEQASSAIGADALLTRVGAYYHDVGKTAQAKYFVENLGHDERSPHDELDPEVSADAIMAHVVIGTKLLREAGMPEPVVEFAYTHHGTQLVEFFWNRCREQGNPKELTEDAFRYPGMKPQTKETAILMLVDSIEAASRTIDPPERAQFETMVQRVIFTKLASGQLDESGLELADLRIIVSRMSDTLVNMHHHRIKYPWQAKKAHEFGVPVRAVREFPSGGYAKIEPPRPLGPVLPVEPESEGDPP